MLGASLGVVLFTASISLFTQYTVDHNHSVFIMHADIAERALQGDLEAGIRLRAIAPNLAEAISDARRNGMAAAFGVQVLIAGIALCIALAWIHTSPPATSTKTAQAD
jgi:hypothetical protein